MSTVKNMSTTYTAKGCMSSNICAAAEILNLLFMESMDSTIAGPYCCERAYCNRVLSPQSITTPLPATSELPLQTTHNGSEK